MKNIFDCDELFENCVKNMVFEDENRDCESVNIWNRGVTMYFST